VGATVDADFEVHVPQEDDDARSNETARKKPVLYLTLKGVMGQYADELRRFIDLEVSTVTTSQVSKFLQDYQVTLDESGTGSFKKVVKVDDEALAAAPGKLFGGAALVVSTYDCIARNPWMISMMDWSGVCLDECHELKTPDAHKTTAVFGKHIDGSPLRGVPILAMSGTFTKNRPADWFVWARLTGADGDCYTAGSLSTARRTFDMRFDALTFERVRGRGGREYTQSRRGARPENGDELKTLMTPFLIRRLKTEIAEIPPVKTRVLRVPSSGVYVHLLSALITGRDLPSETQDILGRHGILAGDRLIDTDQDEDAGMSIRDAARSRNYDDLAQKLSMISSLDKSCGVVEMLKELGWTDPEEPVVIMGLHRAAVREAAERLRDAGETVITMTQEDSAARRREKQEMFTRGDARIFLTSFGVGGTGLNLTRASKILAINLPFIDSYLAQGRDRCHRLGQTRTVEFVIAILSGSIDEATWGMIQNKGRANYATLSVDRVKTGELPRWATAAAANLATEDEAENQLDIRGFRRTARR
jgi:SNF2 family DNA or RNA helicase